MSSIGICCRKVFASRDSCMLIYDCESRVMSREFVANLIQWNPQNVMKKKDMNSKQIRCFGKRDVRMKVEATNTKETWWKKRKSRLSDREVKMREKKQWKMNCTKKHLLRNDFKNIWPIQTSRNEKEMGEKWKSSRTMRMDETEGRKISLSNERDWEKENDVKKTWEEISLSLSLNSKNLWVARGANNLKETTFSSFLVTTT